MKSLNASFSHPVNVRLVVLLVLAAFGLLLSQASWRAYETARETSVAAEANALRFAAAAATYQQSLFDHTRQLLRVLGGISLTEQHDAATCNAFLARQLESFPEYNNLAFADNNGLVWCSARPLPAATAIPGAITASQKNPRLFSFGRDSAAFTLPYFTLDGRLQGAVLAALAAQTLLPIKNTALPPDTEYGMINSQGKLIAAYPSLAAWEGSDFRFAQTLQANSAARVSGPDGERFYISEPVPGTTEELRLIVRLPTDGSGRLASLALLLAALGCTTLVWWALARMLSPQIVEWRAKANAQGLQVIHKWQDKALTLRAKFRALFREQTPRTRIDTKVLRVAYEELKGAFANKEARVRQLVQLDELSQRLQSCANTAELAEAVARCAAAIFPGSSGALFLRTPDQATSALTWSGNETPHTETIDPQDCWALRMGRPYHSHGTSAAACTHVATAVNYVCIPLMAARGELLGVLHLAGLPDNGATAAAIPWAATSIAERSAIALAAVRRQERLQLRAIRDALTGLFNRGFLEEALTIEQQRAVRRGSPIGIMMLDVDHFKRFNDTFGHDAGDALLRGMGGILRRTVREGDMPCRYGGEEFVVILPGADLKGTQQRAEVLRTAIEQWQPQHNGRSLGAVTVSIGVAAFPLHGDTGQAVLKMADQALYAAKHAGRNRVAAPTS
jgi:diguanylate cyclase (GGDEF)-like protein